MIERRYSRCVAGFKSSFQPFHEKQAMLRRVVAELERYDDQGNLRAQPAPSDRPSRRLRGSAEILAEAE